MRVLENEGEVIVEPWLERTLRAGFSLDGDAPAPVRLIERATRQRRQRRSQH